MRQTINCFSSFHNKKKPLKRFSHSGIAITPLKRGVNGKGCEGERFSGKEILLRN